MNTPSQLLLTHQLLHSLVGAYAEHQYPNLGIYGVLQIILSPQSPQLRPTVDDTDGISAHFAALWTLTLLNPTLQVHACGSGALQNSSLTQLLFIAPDASLP